MMPSFRPHPRPPLIPLTTGRHTPFHSPSPACHKERQCPAQRGFIEALKKKQQKLSVKFTEHSEAHGALPNTFCGHGDNPARNPLRIPTLQIRNGQSERRKSCSRPPEHRLPDSWALSVSSHCLPTMSSAVSLGNLESVSLHEHPVPESSKVCSSQPSFADPPWDCSSLPSAPHLCTLTQLLLLG